MRQMIFSILFLMTCLHTTYAQEKIKRITIKLDFYKNNRPPFAKHSAFTSYHFNLKTKLKKATGNTLLLDFDVIFKLDTVKSFMDFEKRKDKDLLRHEQGHADIGVLYARKLKSVLTNSVFPKSGYNGKISTIFNRINSLMLKTNSRYDEETFFGTKKAKQEEWNKLLKSKFLDDVAE
jgi:hypothetical protein